MKTKYVTPLAIVLAVQSFHHKDPDAIPPEEHIEDSYPHTPIPMSRPTAWLTSTSSGTVSDAISFRWSRP